MLQTLDRGLAIMKYLTMSNSASVSEIANVFNIPKSSASRILSTLAYHGMVCQNEMDRRYRLGVGAMMFASQMLNENRLLEAYRPLMRQVMDATGDMVHLAAWNGGEAYTVDLVRRREHAAMRTIAMPGAPVSLYSTAAGKVLLAYAPGEKQQEQLEKMETAQHAVPAESLRAGLALVREQGFALETEENQAKVCSVAVPVFDQQSGVRFALAVTSSRNIAASRDKVDYYLHVLRQCADKMRRKINSDAG